MSRGARNLLIGVAAAVGAVLLLVFPLLFGLLFVAGTCGAGSGGGGGVAAAAVPDNASYKAPEHSDDTVAESIASFAESIALDDSHGYSQARRASRVDYDCSSLVFYAVESAGYQLGSYPFATYTEGTVLAGAGFTHLTWPGDASQAARYLKRGDIVVNPQEHTEVYVGGGLFAGARHATPSGIEDGMPGDQGKGYAQEIGIGPYLDPGLTDVWRHDPSRPAGGPGVSTASSMAASCTPPQTEPAADTVTGSATSAADAKAAARRLIPAYFPGEDTDAQMGCLTQIWDRESGWDYHAENPSSGAYGIPQALPGSKMASAGPDWHDNAVTQVKWGLTYIQGRYRDPCGAWSEWQRKGWY